MRLLSSFSTLSHLCPFYRIAIGLVDFLLCAILINMVSYFSQKTNRKVLFASLSQGILQRNGPPPRAHARGFLGWHEDSKQS